MPEHPSLRPRRRARLGVVVWAAMALAAGLAGWAAPAGAHGGAGTIAILDESSAGALAVDYTVEIRYTIDQHPATPATFVVSGTGPDGATVASTPLERGDTEGVYRARIDYPVAGDWTLTFQSGLPPAELDHDVAVGEGTDDSAVPPSSPPPPSSLPPSSLLPGEPTSVSSSGSGPPAVLVWGVIATAVVFLAGLAVAVWWVRRQRESPAT